MNYDNNLPKELDGPIKRFVEDTKVYRGAVARLKAVKQYEKEVTEAGWNVKEADEFLEAYMKDQGSTISFPVQSTHKL